MIGVTTVYLHGTRVHGSKTCYRPPSQIYGPRWLAKIIFFLKIISRKAQRSVKNIRKTNPVFISSIQQPKKMASIRLAGRTEELGPFSSKKGNTLAWRIQPPRNVFSDRGSADCGPSRTGGSVYFAAKLEKDCAFREKGMDKDEVGKKRKKRSLACRLCFIAESSAWVHPVNLRFLSSIGA